MDHEHSLCQAALVTLMIHTASGIIDWATGNIIDHGDEQNNWSSQIVSQFSKHVPI